MSYVAFHLGRGRAALRAWAATPVPAWGWAPGAAMVRSNAWTRSSAPRPAHPRLRYRDSVS